jgi:hypothetical protein
LVGEPRNSFLVDASRAEEMVAQDVNAICCDFMADRYASGNYFGRTDGWDRDLRWLGTVLLNSEQARFTTRPAGAEGVWRSVRGTFVRFSATNGGRYLFGTGPVARHGLELYNAQRSRARIARAALSAVTDKPWMVRWLPQVSLQLRDDVSEAELGNVTIFDHIRELLPDERLSFAISLGTPGPHQKPVVEISGSDRGVIGYLKIGSDSASESLVRNEASTLRNLQRFHFKTFGVPRVLWTGSWGGHSYCFQSAPEGPSEKQSAKINDKYIDLLMEISLLGRKSERWESSRFWNGAVGAISTIASPYYRHLAERAAAAVTARLGSHEVPFHLCHGDFAPWNIKQSRGAPYLYDWECADEQGSPGWDLFNFITEKRLLLENRTPNQVLGEIISGEDGSGWLATYFRSLCISEELRPALYLAYLMCQLSGSARTRKGSFQWRRQLAALTALTTAELS